MLISIYFSSIAFSLRKIRCFSKRSNSADQGSCPHFANAAAIHLLGLFPRFFHRNQSQSFQPDLPFLVLWEHTQPAPWQYYQLWLFAWHHKSASWLQLCEVYSKQYHKSDELMLSLLRCTQGRLYMVQVMNGLFLANLSIYNKQWPLTMKIFQ